MSGLEKASEVSVTIPTIDTTAIQKEMGAIGVSMKTFQQTAQTLTAQLPAMQEKLQINHKYEGSSFRRKQLDSYQNL
ncbi:MAG: hypothetical protein V8S55_03810 [Mediterraneibacter faecis]